MAFGAAPMQTKLMLCFMSFVYVYVCVLCKKIWNI